VAGGAGVRYAQGGTGEVGPEESRCSGVKRPVGPGRYSKGTHSVVGRILDR
jgi:hypothetical protein